VTFQEYMEVIDLKEVDWRAIDWTAYCVPRLIDEFTWNYGNVTS
jgi:hypothetical protein